MLNASRHHGTWISGRWTVILWFLFTLVGCATNDPQRSSLLSWDGQAAYSRPSVCDKPYANTDALIWREMQDKHTSVDSRERLNDRVAQLITPDLKNPSERAPCWETAYENHQNLPAPDADVGSKLIQAPGYDLLYAEFDDQGERTDVSLTHAAFHAAFEKSEVALIESQLDALVKQETSAGGGLNVVLFTHGWHGNADATKTNSSRVFDPSSWESQNLMMRRGKRSPKAACGSYMRTRHWING